MKLNEEALMKAAEALEEAAATDIRIIETEFVAQTAITRYLQALEEQPSEHDLTAEDLFPTKKAGTTCPICGAPHDPRQTDCPGTGQL